MYTKDATTDTISTFVEVAGDSMHDKAISFIGPDGSAALKRWHSLIGIVTAIVGNILISFALNIQRYAHIRLNGEKIAKERSRTASRANTIKSYGSTGAAGQNGSDDHEREEAEAQESEPLIHAKRASMMYCDDGDHFQKTTYLHSPYWWAGITLMTIGEAGNFLAYGFAPASIVSPLGVVALISNCIIAPFMLKEEFRLRDFWGIAIATGGAVVVVLSAKTSEKKLGPHEVWDAITATEFEVYMGVTVFLILMLLWASPRYGHKTVLVDLGLVGLFGGYTALSTKGVASMFSSTLWRAFTTPVTYALLAVLLGTAVMQVRYVNKALQRFDSTQVIPVQFVLFTLSVIVGSAILYRDFEHGTAKRLVKFAGGCLLTFLGVSFITSGRGSHDEDEDKEAGDEEDDEVVIPAQNSRDVRPPFSSRTRTSRSCDVFVDEMEVSREPSHFSFAERTPKTPIRLPSTESVPEIRLTETPDLQNGDGAELESATLPSNAWRRSPNYIASSPSRQHSTSNLPTEARSSLPPLIEMDHPPKEIQRTHSQDNPHTHPKQQTLNPPQPDPAVRPATPARTSLSLIMPGPLSSPLSGGLSVVVADSLRRGVDPSFSAGGARSRKSSRSGPRRTKSSSQGLLSLFESESRDEVVDESSSNRNQVGGSDVQRTSHGKRSTTRLGEEDRSTSETFVPRSRARSLSIALGDFLRGRKGKPASDGDAV